MNRNRQIRGFSLIELVVVVAIIMLIAAMAVPNMTLGLATFRLRSAVSGLSGTMQRARIEAVRTNRFITIRTTNANNTTVAFVDLDNDSVVDVGEPRIAFPPGTFLDFAGPATAFPSLQLIGYAQPATASASVNFPMLVGFNARGLPCAPTPTAGAATGCTFSTGNNGGFLYYFRTTTSFGVRWAALTITPTGRMRVWTLGGTTWR